MGTHRHLSKTISSECRREKLHADSKKSSEKMFFFQTLIFNAANQVVDLLLVLKNIGTHLWKNPRKRLDEKNTTFLKEKKNCSIGLQTLRIKMLHVTFHTITSCLTSCPQE